MAKTANEQFYDAMVRHQTYLLRHSNYVQRRIITLLNQTEPQIAMLIRDRLARSTGLNTPADWKRLEVLLASVKAIRAGAWNEANQYWLESSIELVLAEPVAVSSMMSAALPVVISTALPSSRLLRSIVMSRPFEGRVLKDWATTMASDDLRKIGAAIQTGMVMGEGSALIARRVVGTGTLKGADGITQATRNQVAAITRTAVQHIANNARKEFMQENADIIDEEQYVATLDGRTTAQCKALDMQVFKLGEGPLPPLHFGCRSLRIAYFSAERAGERPARAFTEKQILREFTQDNDLGNVATRNGLPRGTKGKYDEYKRKRIRELTGTLPAHTSYQQWLTRQSVEFQNDTLGITKAKLFREGGLTLDKFVARDGSELTLAELAKREASAFKAAGLDVTNY